MDQKRFDLLKKRADNCIEKFKAIVNNQTDSAKIHDINTTIWYLQDDIRIIEKYGESFVGYITKKPLDLSWLESKIKEAEKYLIDLAFRIL